MNDIVAKIFILGIGNIVGWGEEFINKVESISEKA